jgi:hypothetical protein
MHLKKSTALSWKYSFQESMALVCDGETLNTLRRRSFYPVKSLNSEDMGAGKDRRIVWFHRGFLDLKRKETSFGQLVKFK